MKVKLQHLGWTKAADCVEWRHPSGYHSYILYAANGIVCNHYEWADSNKAIKDGEYDFPDAMFDPDDPKWDSECDIIEE